MKNKQKKELRQKSIAELTALLVTKREELKKAQLYTLDERNKNKRRNLKKDIARIATIANEKEVN